MEFNRNGRNLNETALTQKAFEFAYLKLYKMQVKRAVTYGSEAWTQDERYKRRESAEIKKDKKVRVCAKSEKMNTEVHGK